MSDRPDWDQWILQKNAEYQAEELRKASSASGHFPRGGVSPTEAHMGPMAHDHVKEAMSMMHVKGKQPFKNPAPVLASRLNDKQHKTIRDHVARWGGSSSNPEEVDEVENHLRSVDH